MKTRIEIVLALLGVLVLFGAGVQGIHRYHGIRRELLREESLLEALRRADGIERPAEAIEAYERIGPSCPEARLRILERKWAQALDLLHQIQRAKFNRELEGEVPGIYDELEEHLASMREACGDALTGSPPPRSEVAWRLHNLEGAVRLLSAFTILEREKNWKKVKASVAASIAAFKSAIEEVDTAEVSNLEKKIPRWNVELLHADVYVKSLLAARPDAERLGLRENLEAVIPEKGGYAPGEPLERRILK